MNISSGIPIFYGIPLFLHPVGMRSYFIYIFFCLLGIQVNGQSVYHYAITVKDAESLGPIENAHITFMPNGGNAVTNKSGKIDAYLKIQVNKLRISHVQYGDTTITLHSDGKIQKIVILLNEKRINLPEATIFNGPDTIYGHPEWHVADYVFTDNGMVLLTYGHRRKFKRENEQGIDLYEECRLVWLNQLGDVDFQHPVNETCVSLHSDYPGVLFLTTRNKIYQVGANADQLLLTSIDHSVFENKIKPIVGKTQSKMVGTSYSSRYPAFDVFAFQPSDTAAKIIAHVEDQELMTQFLSEYKWMSTRGKLEAVRYELKTGIDKEIVAGFMTGFPESIYFKPLFSPVFTTDSMVYLFDHYKHHLYVYNDSDLAVDSLPINYYRGEFQKTWDDQLLFDKKSNRAYGVYAKSGKYSLREINLTDGSLGPKFDITWKYPENLTVQNGFVYYLYRPFESPQNTYLYKEPIPDLMN